VLRRAARDRRNRTARLSKSKGAPDIIVALPKVTFLPANIEARFEPHRLPYRERGLPGSILDIALNFGVPLDHTCGGCCACTTCHVIIRAGEENLSKKDDCEADRLDIAPGVTLRSRLACQAVVRGDVVVEIPRG
jgi:2Fe-2S ferredoxin